jgi:hypothetical protein
VRNISGTGIFKEIQLFFLIVGHTHIDIDQRFSTISSALKRQDIISLKELLSIIKEKPTRTEPFVVAEHLEHIRDWKSFITPYLWQDGFIGTSQPHHFRFYMDNTIPRVQYKMYTRSPMWEPNQGYECLDAVPSIRLPIQFAPVTDPEPRDIKVLEDYITLKERYIARHQDVDRNIEAVFETDWLISYLKEFPTTDRMEAIQAPFWPIEDVEEHQVRNEDVPSSSAQHESILAQLPPVMVRGYFGPRSMRPRGQRIRQHTMSPSIRNNTFRSVLQRPRNMTVHGYGSIPRRDTGRTQTSAFSAVQSGDPFPTFDPRKDVMVGMFVAIETGEDDQLKGIPFFIAKVIQMERQATDDGTVTVLWYEPRMRRGETDDVGNFHRRYYHCIDRPWIPSRESNDIIPIDTIIIAWKNTVRTLSLTSVNNIRTEKQIIVPTGQKFHLQQYLEYINWLVEEEN